MHVIRGKVIAVLFLGAWTSLCAPSAPGLIMVGEGNETMDDPGFPEGALSVVNRESRTGFREGPPFGGGEYLFTFRESGTEGFNRALADFARIRLPGIIHRSLVSLNGELTTWRDETPLLLVIRDAGTRAKGFAGDEGRIDWTFHVWIPERFHALFSGDATWQADHPNFRQPIPPPRIDVFVGEGYPVQWADVELPEGVTVQDHLGSENAGGGAIRGRVVDMGTHAGLADARVRLVPVRGSGDGAEHSAGTDATGDYTMPDVPPGRYELYAEAAGHASRVVGTFRNGPGVPAGGVDILLALTGMVSGVILDTDGEALPGLTIAARDLTGLDGRGYVCLTEHTATTGPEGRFQLAGLPVGTASLRVRAPDLYQLGSIRARHPVRARMYPDAEEARIVMTGTGSVNIELSAAADRALSSQYVTELEPEGGSRVGAWSGSAIVEPGGSYRFDGVPPGTYVLTVRPNPGREADRTAPMRIHITAGSSTNIAITAP